jgi:peptidoglycan/LPS O-acetylase OafA/YrhL
MAPDTIHTNKKKLYFSNLDGLRAIAVLLVVAWHIEIHKVRFGFKQLYFNDLGFIGVSIFFILSGFLITYILLVEKEINHHVNFKGFYMRRILRIWPLYFFALLFGVFIYPRGMDLSTFAMCLFLCPNIPFMMMHLHPFVQPIWTIGVEEQFYLFQPQFFRIKNSKLMLLCIISLTILLIIIKQLGAKFPNISLIATAGNYLYFFRIDQLLMGSITAIILYNYKNKKASKRWLIRLGCNKYVQLIAWVYFAGHIFTPSLFNYLFAFQTVFILSVVIIVINLCIPKTSIIQLDNRYIRYIGKVSYGIYLLHNIVLISILYLLKTYFNNLGPILTNLVIYGLTFPLAILLAGISYKYYESYFLKLKVKYSTVIKTK